MRQEQLGYHFTQFTFRQILADKANRNGDKLFLHFLPDGRKFSYREIDDASNRIANSLLARGIGKGTHVAMLMENSPEQVLAFFALGKIGAVAVPLNIAARGPFLHYYLNQSESTVLFVDAGLLKHFRALPERSPIRNVFVVSELNGEQSLPDDRLARLEHFAELAKGLADAPEVEVSYADPCGIMYTSGTTGPSKGNIFSQIHTLAFGLGQVAPLKFCADDIYHVCMPLFHVGAYGGALLTMLMVDGGVALTRRLSVSSFWSEVRESDATCGMLLSVTGFLLNQPASGGDRQHRLRMAIATPVPVHVAEFEERFNVRLVSGYGLSDYGLAFSHLIDGPLEKRLSIGVPHEDVSARIVDDNDIDVPIGEVGELILRKDGLPLASTEGYYNMPQATLASRKNLWFHTGDRCWKDESGYFYFADRKKDAIRRRGENISAHELEQAIAKHRAIADVAAYPVSAGSGDEDVAVTIVLRPGLSLTEIELIEHCVANMPYYMVPRYIDFRDEMPRTMTQKVIKHVLRSHVEENPADVWDRERAGVKIQRN